MKRSRLRLFLCVALGLAAGLLVGSVRSSWGPAYRHSTARTLSKELFESGITAGPRANFRVSGLVVHPPGEDGIYWVTGTYHEQRPGGVRQGPFKFPATTPYSPRLAVDAAADTLTVRQYLDELAARVPQAKLGYRYAWSERPAAGIALCGAIGLIVGAMAALVVRPTAPQVATREGEVPAAPLPDFPNDLGSAGASPSRVDSPSREAPIAPQDEKHFGGEFYPTEVHADESGTP